MRDFLNDCLAARTFPTSANLAKMWLIPKNEKGISDLAFTRPIALMESIAKLYERLLCYRIMKILTDNGMLDPAQFGSVPKGGTDVPLCTVANLLDDARLSGQQLCLLSLDVAKAFDSCEYWSQALSWAALGMPPQAIKLLLQMDSTATTQVNLGGGHYTRPVSHGRGVRQGSILGPLKWVVFTNWWIKGVDARMRGKGYKMSATVRDKTVEVKSQVFVDDCNAYLEMRPGTVKRKAISP